MNIRKLITAAAVVSLLVSPAAALAFDDSTADDTGFSIDAFDDQFQGIETDAGLVDTIINIINALLVLAAIAAIVFVIIGGVRYVTAQGDEDAVAQAKNTIIYAIIGIIIIILAAVIVNFFVAQVAT
jgi:hypothetical protein